MHAARVPKGCSGRGGLIQYRRAVPAEMHACALPVREALNKSASGMHGKASGMRRSGHVKTISVSDRRTTRPVCAPTSAANNMRFPRRVGAMQHSGSRVTRGGSNCCGGEADLCKSSKTYICARKGTFPLRTNFARSSSGEGLRRVQRGGRMGIALREPHWQRIATRCERFRRKSARRRALFVEVWRDGRCSMMVCTTISADQKCNGVRWVVRICLVWQAK